MIQAEQGAREEPFIIYADEKPIDVTKHYAHIHKMPLPVTPTMSGHEIKLAVDAVMSYQLFKENDHNRADDSVGDSEAIPLSRGLRFYTVPPATWASTPPLPGLMALPEPFGYLLDMGEIGEQFVKAKDLGPEHGMRAKEVTALFTHPSVTANSADLPEPWQRRLESPLNKRSPFQCIEDEVRDLRQHIAAMQATDTALRKALADACNMMVDMQVKLDEYKRLFLGCSYPVSTDIDSRGYRWSEAWLDEFRAALTAAKENKDD